MADLLAGAAYMCSIVMELNIYCIMSQIVVNEVSSIIFNFNVAHVFGFKALDAELFLPE